MSINNKIASAKRITEFLLDNIGNDREAGKLYSFITENAIEGWDNHSLSAAYDQMKRLDLIGNSSLKAELRSIQRQQDKVYQQYAYINDIPEGEARAKAYKTRSQQLKKAEKDAEKVKFWTEHSAPPKPRKTLNQNNETVSTPPPAKEAPKTPPNQPASTQIKGEAVNYDNTPPPPKTNAAEVETANNGMFQNFKRKSLKYGTGAVTAGALVLALNSTRGQQTNAQLYGQQPIYY